ncbi:3D domain-containing protein [Vagococcus lutrae]|uniref:3D domain-containing protein n=1 Tax=Vagococcus lutrae TaxID=81947 RepID=UPI00288CBA90|nr:3D domain-containing protein [Vagococcus lutrae]MDT2811778.1 3D domain-containing protein [Vagococcus lutrae]
MNPKKMMTYLLLACLSLTSFSVPAYAESIREIKEKEQQVKDESEQIDSMITNVMASINKKYEAIAEIEKNIASSEKRIDETQKEIGVTKATIAKRKEVVAERLKGLQLKGASREGIQTILEAENLSDFLSRAYAVTVMQSAESEKIASLFAEQERLTTLETELETTQKELKTQQASVKTEQQALDSEMAGLEEKLAENNTVLKDLTDRRIAQESKERREREAQEKAKREQQEKVRKEKETAEKAAQTANTESATTAPSQPETTPAPTPTPAPEKPSAPEQNQSGNMLSGQATAYIATGNKTATGTVPAPHRTIAVDPSVIPLGSLVQIEVPSNPAYSGVYRAEDTGGVVKGHIIDIFVSSQGEAVNFGRRSILFKVL